MITAGSFRGSGSDQDSNENGLPFNHAFSIMRPLSVFAEDGSEIRLVEMRNPWGEEKFNGTWSDTSENWTEDLRDQAEHFSDNDGKFYMSFEDYVKQLEYTEFNMDV